MKALFSDFKTYRTWKFWYWQIYKIVKERNDTAHSNGNIFYKNKESLEGKINEMLSCVESIQEKSKAIIEKAFRDFLFGSQNPDEREFLDDESQVKRFLFTSIFRSRI